MTNSRLSPPAHVERLLQTNRMMTVRQLYQALNGRAGNSVFRDLKQIRIYLAKS